MFNFFSIYGSAILRILNLLLWAFWYRRNELKGFNSSVIKFFLGFNLIHIAWNISMITSLCHPKVYIGFWILISIFELFFITSALFQINSIKTKYFNYYSAILSILSIPIILAGLLSSMRWDYRPINITDFNLQILLMIGSIFILKSILSQDNFLNNIESFFIFSGLVMLFGINILASNSHFFGFLKNWKFGHNATVVTQFFWLGGVFASWKIRSKYLS